MTTYTADCERGDGWWAVRVPEVPGVFTQARRLDQVEAMTRDAIATMLDIPAESIDIEVHPVLPPGAADAMGWLDKARSEAADAQKVLTETTINTAEVLVKCGLTVRDAGRIMGVSHQRIDQLVHARR